MAEGTWPTHAAPRITELTFANALIENDNRVFKGIPEIGTIWNTLLQHGVDPSFALGQFWTESLFGTAGWNVWSEPPLRSWGNILYVNSLIKDRPGVSRYDASNGFTYTVYPDWTTGAEDYCLLLEQYAKEHDDPRYGDTALIYGATAKWMADPPGSEGHLRYFDVVLGRMERYDIRPAFEGDMIIVQSAAIETPLQIDTNMRYSVKAGDRWYVKPGGAESYAIRKDRDVVFAGQVAGTSWFAIRLRTSRFSSDETSDTAVVYMPNFRAARVKVITTP